MIQVYVFLPGGKEILVNMVTIATVDYLNITFIIKSNIKK